MRPTPWAAYAFAPTEAVAQALYLPLFLLFAPVHLGVIIFFVWHMIVRNAIGHSGYEIFPRGWASQRWLGLITPVTHHELHHEKGGGNFGLYFTWWDRIMGTEHAEYHARFAQVTADGTAADVPATEF